MLFQSDDGVIQATIQVTLVTTVMMAVIFTVMVAVSGMMIQTDCLLLTLHITLLKMLCQEPPLEHFRIT